MKLLLALTIMVIAHAGQAQLYIQRGAAVHLSENATVYVAGDVTSFNSIDGNGSIILNGHARQQINFNGTSLPNLLLFNANDVELKSDLRVRNSLVFMNGKILVDRYRLILEAPSKIELVGNGGISTGEAGLVRKYISSDLNKYSIPLMNEDGIATLHLTTSGNYHQAYVDVRSVAKVPVNIPEGVKQYLDNYWLLDQRGIEGEMNVVASLPVSSVNKPIVHQLSAFARNSNVWTSYGSQLNGQLVFRKLKTGESILTAMSGGDRVSLTLSPNPATDNSRLTIVSDAESRAEISIIDSRGRIVNTRSVTLSKGVNNNTIDVSGLTNGSYEIVVNQRGYISTLKLIKR